MRLFTAPSLLLLAALAPVLAQAQQSPLATPEPQLNPDSSVTFRLQAPAATKVALALEGTPDPIPMLPGTAPATWTLTTKSLTPAYYSYHFLVDGQNTLDPRNPLIKSSYLAAGNSLLIQGHPARPWETTAVPHGTLHHHTFTTKIVLGLPANQDEFYVYTPPSYDPKSPTKYPVLYLLHGWSDTASGWSTIGHANDILDNLIAAGKAKPMIVVMPLGYGDMAFLKSFSVWNHKDVVDHNTALFTDSLLTEILPQVEHLYNTATDPNNRAIAGLSMGGLESLTIGLTHPDKFAYVGGFSSAVHLLDPTILTNPTQPKLLWIACGTSDNLIESNRRLITALTAAGDHPIPIETPGAHTWLVWRENLVSFAPLLFQN